MKRAALIAALLLPFLVLGAGIVRHQAALSEAQEWRIPIAGYDPRDALRGRYIVFTYAWRTAGNTDQCTEASGCNICLSHEGSEVVATVVPVGQQCPSRVDPSLSRIDIRPGFRTGQTATFGSRIFVSEVSAPMLEEQLRTQPMIVVAALAPDGRLINQRIEPARH